MGRYYFFGHVGHVASEEGEVMECMVYVEAVAPEGVAVPDLADASGVLVDKLEGHSPGVGLGARSWNVTVAVDGFDAPSAAETGVRMVVDAARVAGFPDWPIARVEATDYVIVEDEQTRSNFPDIVGAGEVLEILGVSKQRLHQLRASDRFPEPVMELKSGPIWMRPAIERWAAEDWVRTPGRVAHKLGPFEVQSRERSMLVAFACSCGEEFSAERAIAGGSGARGRDEAERIAGDEAIARWKEHAGKP